MFHQKVKQCFSHPVHPVSSVISELTYLGIGLTKNRKFPVDELIIFLVSQGSSSARSELLDFFDIDPQSPTASTLNRQRTKLSPGALGAIFRHFNHLASSYDQRRLRCRFLTVDSSIFTFFNEPTLTPEEYHVSEGYPVKGFYNMHLNAFYGLRKHAYSDALIQPIHQKGGFGAFCEIVDHRDLLTGTKDVFTGDRGYYSHSNMVHMEKEDQYFLFRTKDTHPKGLVGDFGFPDADFFDIQVDITLVHSHKKEISIKEGYYKRPMNAAASFDYVAYGSLNAYDLSSRTVRSPISDDSYECIVTDLPSDKFSSE